MPWATLQRYWRAWTTNPPPTALQELINTVGTSRPLDLYIPTLQTTASTPVRNRPLSWFFFGSGSGELRLDVVCARGTSSGRV